MAKTKTPKQAPTRRAYKMTVAGQMFKHLGLQMYAGAVPAISELISNAYDGMARNVWVTVPTGRPIEASDQIVVRDDGHGMTYAECNSAYLSVGRNRRAGNSDWTQPYNGLKPRKVQGRKGIGKLAGFGVADRIEIRTVKDRQISAFALDFQELTRSETFADARGYAPTPLTEDGQPTRERPSTTITLSHLKITRTVPEDQLRAGLARRLLALDKDFTVHVNDHPIKREEIPLQFRFPEKPGTWETADLGNGQQVQWWAGFSKDTIPDEEQRGFVVYVRGKLAQEPWFFDLSGGVWGQHGMQYLTGEVRADFLDETVDLIATDRGAVRWEDPLAVPLRDWGRKKIKELLEAWTDKRREAKVKSPKISQYIERASKLPDRERKVFLAVVDKIVAIPQLDKDKEGKDIADELVEFAYNALTNRSFFEAIRRLNAASTEDIAHFSDILSEWDILEAVNTAHLVKGRVEIIRKFKQMIKERVPEKPDMQDYLKDHPWLIDPKWTVLTHEQSLDGMIAEQFHLQSPKSKEGARRLDFFCLGDRYQTAHVVETKRPNDLIGRKEFDQVRDYVLFLRRKLQDESSDPAHRRSTVRGLIIADRVRSGDEGHGKAGQDAGLFDIRTWTNLLNTTETLHKEFLDVIRERAPAGDPRMEDLSIGEKERPAPKRGKRGRIKKLFTHKKRSK
jgi:Histidine kinase-, DNA gyrase B-, and HSP90-like ATPase